MFCLIVFVRWYSVNLGISVAGLPLPPPGPFQLPPGPGVSVSELAGIFSSHPSLGLASCICCPHSASWGPGVTAVDPARCARMALQMRHAIPPLGEANSMWLSQKTLGSLVPTVCLMSPLSPREPGVPVVSREETRQAYSWGVGI